MEFNNFIQPSTLFIIWYIIPGYLALHLFILYAKFFYPTLAFSLKNVKAFDKLVFSIIISTIIFSSYFYQQEKGLVDVLSVSSIELLGLMAMSMLLAVGLSIVLFIFIVSLNDYLVPFVLFLYLIIKRTIFRKNIQLNFFEDYYQIGPFKLGPIYDLTITEIENNYKLGNKVEVKLKSSGEVKKGIITGVKRDYSEIEIEKNDLITIIKTEDICYFSYKHNPKKSRLFEIASIKKRVWIVAILSLPLLFYKFYLIIIPILLLIFKFCVVDKWESTYISRRRRKKLGQALRAV